MNRDIKTCSGRLGKLGKHAAPVEERRATLFQTGVKPPQIGVKPSQIGVNFTVSNKKYINIKFKLL
jgi:hypothetical protein